ncbi:hypothetical protein GK047_01455 [Paenibacillus sp. SYP-B3998]|uniref:Uncharacterized protein n=1 Tax=Paenibacillus sp. SYP-B3998 TaxID=2678564 RepID=A0A6G3ZR54_9BACL|nr:hypothetical protein [Paenibacillus sp. SYP-B3998]NEW04686.1 hypothetical protein [Paenibacillus sp. SYP-B3998]
MNTLAEKYSQLIQQEDSYFKQVRTTEMCMTALFEYTIQYGELLNKLAVEDILNAIHQIEMNMRTELLHLRLEKAFLACAMKEY